MKRPRPLFRNRTRRGRAPTDPPPAPAPDPPSHCTLCDGPLVGGAMLGVWAPDERWVRRLSSARFERELIASVLCGPCAARPDQPTVIEDALIERIEGELAAEAEVN